MNRIVAIAVWLLCVSGFALSQTEVPKFSSRSELVLVPAVVTDKSGGHISNLSKNDFVLLEDGKPQTISVFDEVKTSPALVQRTPTPTGHFSNLLQTSNGPRRLVIVALDVINTPILLQGSARNELLKFLGKSLDPGEPTELVIFGRSGVTILHDFTEDPAALVATLQRLPGKGASLAEKESVSQAPHDGDGLSAMLRMLAHMENEDKARMEAFDRHAAILATLDALKQIAASVAGIPGRKALLWVGSGFPFSVSQTDTAPSLGSVQDAYEHTWRLLNQAQVAVYPIDVRSLTNSKFHGVDEPGTKHMPWEATGDDPYTDILLRDDKEQQEILTTLKNFADATGGRAFYDTNDLQRGFREAVSDNSNYYMLGYYLNRQGKKPGWHKLQVKLQQRGGVEIRARNAFLLTNGSSREQTRSDLITALQSPIAFTGIPVQGDWTGSSPSGDKNKKVGFELVLPAGFAEIDESAGNHLHVEFLAEARAQGDDRSKDAPVRVSQTLDVRLDAKGIEQIRSSGMTYRNALKLPPGEYNVHFVVLDALSGRMGSVSTSLKIDP